MRTGIKPDVDSSPAAVDEPSAQNLSRRPISLFTLFLVVVVFLALGGAVALVVNDVHDGSPQNPTVTVPGTVSSRPPGTTQPPTTSTLPTTSTTESPTTTAAPTTTQEPATTSPPTTIAPTTIAPTTIAPTTIAPTTVAPTTVAPAAVTAVSAVTSTIPG
jgi:cytoskeletal protein RodZ